MEVDLSADLCLGLGQLSESLDKHRKSLRWAAAHVTPVFGRGMASGPVPATGPLVLYLGGPDLGHFWYVRQIAVGGLTPQTVAPGRADVYVSASGYSQSGYGQANFATEVGLQDWRDQAVSLPLIGAYSRGELPLRLNEHLFVVISNGTVAQNYVATVQYEDFEESYGKQTWDM